MSLFLDQEKQFASFAVQVCVWCVCVCVRARMCVCVNVQASTIASFLESKNIVLNIVIVKLQDLNCLLLVSS